MSLLIILIGALILAASLSLIIRPVLVIGVMESSGARVVADSVCGCFEVSGGDNRVGLDCIDCGIFHPGHWAYKIRTPGAMGHPVGETLGAVRRLVRGRVRRISHLCFPVIKMPDGKGPEREQA